MPIEKDWLRKMEVAQHACAAARAAIEALSELAPAEADMFVCFAGNTVRGSEALLEKADAAFRRELSRS